MAPESTVPQDAAQRKSYSNTRLVRLLSRLGACSEGRDWLGTRDLETAWKECERADYLLWFTARIGVDRRLMVKAAAACAETALQFVPAREERPRLAIEAARRWSEDPSEENQRLARKAYADAAYDAYADAAYDAYAYAAAAYAAAADAYAAAADRQSARMATLKRCADLVRAEIPFAAVLEACHAR